MQSLAKKIIIAIVGATATGKSSLALNLAQNLNTEIISADSRLIYCDMNIGTAKPSPKERLKVKHHLIDVITPDTYFSLADYLRLARPCLDDLFARAQIPIIVGGTGLYFRGLLEGLELTDVPPDIDYRQELLTLDTEKLFAMLSPIKQCKLHPNDRTRIIRSLEIERQGQIITSSSLLATDTLADCTILWYGLSYTDREILRTQIKNRVQHMLQEGLLDEVQMLIEKYGRLGLLTKTIGYKECLMYLSGEIPDEKALIDRISIATSQYAKRQMTWFRANQAIQWLNAQSPSDALTTILDELHRLDF